MKKRLLSILLTLCMIFTMMPAMGITASAAPATAVYVGGQDVVNGLNITYWLDDSAGGIMGGGDEYNYNVKYDPNGVMPTLTLNNVDITEAYADSASLYGIYANGDLTIELAAGSTNTITGEDYPGNSSCGIYIDGAIIFQGSGTLSTAGGSASFSYGIFAFTTISILGCTVTAKGT
ncbi:MAG: S-layer protein, partial [Caproiciproducens sp.]|nr:S-layer protein [Caproiciproducens sp.]